jgi:hypothetical protein
MSYIVQLDIYISEAGVLDKIESAEEKDPYDFYDAAVSVLKRAKWKPGLKNGKPVNMKHRISIKFVLE